MDKVFPKIYFFGDKTMEGGNDWEIANSPRIEKAFTVTSPADTVRFVRENFTQKK